MEFDYLQYTFSEGSGLTVLHAIMGFKLTMVTNVSFSERLAIANISYIYMYIDYISVSLEMSHFPSIFVPLPFSLCCMFGEYVVHFFLPGGVFLPCDRGLDFLRQPV